MRVREVGTRSVAAKRALDTLHRELMDPVPAVLKTRLSARFRAFPTMGIHSEKGQSDFCEGWKFSRPVLQIEVSQKQA
jgi:hypothetical protein